MIHDCLPDKDQTEKYQQSVHNKYGHHIVYEKAGSTKSSLEKQCFITKPIRKVSGRLFQKVCFAATDTFSMLWEEQK